MGSWPGGLWSPICISAPSPDMRRMVSVIGCNSRHRRCGRMTLQLIGSPKTVHVLWQLNRYQCIVGWTTQSH